jgi:prefoldin subunit 5
LLERLLADAQALRELVGIGGASTTTSNALAIVLLKAQAFASSGGLPGEIQLELGAISGLDQGASAQKADLDALLAVLEGKLAELETSIQDLSRELLSNEGYDFLNVEFPTDDPVSLAIKERYPDLFEMGDLAALTEATLPDNPLETMTDERSKELLQLQDLESIPEYTAAAEPLSVAIEKLHDEVDALQAQLEVEQAQQRELTRARDLAWQSYRTLADKVAEVDIATGVGGTQVRFAAPAVPPRFPASPRKKLNIALGGVLGLMVGFAVAFGAEYLGRANGGKE